MPNAVASSSGARPVTQRPRPTLLRARPASRRLAVIESKLQVPRLDVEVVSRPGLVNRLRAERLRLITLVAPAGYGKTTILAQWADRDERAVVWLSLDEHDNDARVLVRHLAAAFGRVGQLDGETLDAVAADGPVWTLAGPALLTAVASFTRPFVCILDNAHSLRRGEAADLVFELFKNVPERSVLALAGRSEPPLPLSRLRLTGRLLELRTEDLALNRREAQLLANGARVHGDALTELLRASEGWPAGLRIAAFAGSAERGAREVVDYVRAEHLDTLKRSRRAFLRRTSILEKMSGSLCDATLGSGASARQLESLRRSNLFVVPVEGADGWYRYHRMFRDVLRAELEREEPELVPRLHARASEWFEAHGDKASALDHALAAGDVAHAGRLFAAVALPTWHNGALATLETWLAELDEHGDVAAQPGLAVLGAWFHALQGRAGEAERWLTAAEARAARAKLPDGTPVKSAVSLLRAGFCGHGVARMRRDLHTARAALPVESAWLPLALLLEGVVALLADDRETAERHFREAADAAGRVGATVIRTIALAQRALLAEAAGRFREAEHSALEAQDELDAKSLEGYATSAIVRAAAARAALRLGRWDDACRELAAGEQNARRLTHAIPWLAVEIRLAFARTSVALRDRARALGHLEELESIFAERPHLGAYARELEDVRVAIAELPSADGGRVTGLTAAELRLFPLLATHLSFREIGERLFVSRNTIKTQAISAYRKLGVSSRSAAIARAAELGLIDDRAAERPFFTPTG